MAKRKSKKKELNRIKEVLKEKQKTQVWLAAQLGMSFQTITRYANNDRQPTILGLFEIARVLRVEAQDLLND